MTEKTNRRYCYRWLNSTCMYGRFPMSKIVHSKLMQAYIKSVIQFGSNRSKLLMFLNRS